MLLNHLNPKQRAYLFHNYCKGGKEFERSGGTKIAFRTNIIDEIAIAIILEKYVLIAIFTPSGWSFIPDPNLTLKENGDLADELTCCVNFLFNHILLGG